MTPEAAVAGRAITSVIFELPGTPDIRLSPNRRTSPRTLSGVRRRARDQAEMACRAWRNANGFYGDDVLFAGPTRIRVTVVWEKGRKVWDPDNLTAALKYLDCLERSGIIDNDKHLVWDPVRQIKSGDRSGSVIVELENIEA